MLSNSTECDDAAIKHGSCPIFPLATIYNEAETEYLKELYSDHLVSIIFGCKKSISLLNFYHFTNYHSTIIKHESVSFGCKLIGGNRMKIVVQNIQYLDIFPGDIKRKKLHTMFLLLPLYVYVWCMLCFTCIMH